MIIIKHMKDKGLKKEGADKEILNRTLEDIVAVVKGKSLLEVTMYYIQYT